MIRFGVIGAGAWGTALASTLAGNGPVTLWAREAEVIAAINTTRENSVFLPGIPLPAGITATLTSISLVLGGYDGGQTYSGTHNYAVVWELHALDYNDDEPSGWIFATQSFTVPLPFYTSASAYTKFSFDVNGSWRLVPNRRYALVLRTATSNSSFLRWLSVGTPSAPNGGPGWSYIATKNQPGGGLWTVPGGSNKYISVKVTAVNGL